MQTKASYRQAELQALTPGEVNIIIEIDTPDFQGHI